MKKILKILKDKRGFIGSIIEGAAGIAGSAISAKAAREAQKMQINWERERAKNAHQWEVQDLKAAGLNPILSAGGSGAVTAGISAPMPDISGITSAGNAFSKAAQRAIERKRVKQEGEQIDANIAKTEEEKKGIELQNAVLEANLPTAKREAEMRQKYLNNPIGKTLHYIGMGMSEISPLVGGAIGGGAFGMLNKATSAAKAKNAAKKAEQKRQNKAKYEERQRQQKYYPTGGQHKWEGEYIGMGKGVYRK